MMFQVLMTRKKIQEMCIRDRFNPHLLLFIGELLSDHFGTHLVYAKVFSLKLSVQFPYQCSPGLLCISWSVANLHIQILTMFLSVRLVTGHPTLSSSVTCPLPSENCLIHQYTVFFQAFSPYTCTNIPHISLLFFPSFTRNLLFVRCSNSSTYIFMTARACVCLCGHTHKHKQYTLLSTNSIQTLL